MKTAGIVSGASSVLLAAVLAAGAHLTDESQAGSAQELARQVFENEIRSQQADQSRWMYILRKQVAGKQLVQQAIETGSGSRHSDTRRWSGRTGTLACPKEPACESCLPIANRGPAEEAGL